MQIPNSSPPHFLLSYWCAIYPLSTLAKLSESNSIRSIPSHSEICFWAIRIHSDPIRKTLRTLLDVKRLKINPTQSYSIRGVNPVQSGSIRINLNPFHHVFIMINLDWKFDFDQFKFGLIRIEKWVWIYLDWIRLTPRIDS